MNLETWDKLSPKMQEEVIGRKRSTGAPLTGIIETDPADFTAKRDSEFVIAEDAHIRRASTDRNILRRVYNFDDGFDDRGANVGLLFAAFQAELEQFTVIQERLAQQDSLNTWTTPVGSAVFAVLPGATPGEWLGQSVFG
jgi:dye decolorizing peroxidase